MSIISNTISEVEETKEPVHQFKPYSELSTTTFTVISVSNININTNLVLKYLPISDYVVIAKKRGRKKKETLIDPNVNVPCGSIIRLKLGTQERGKSVKKTKSREKVERKDGKKERD